MSTCAHAIRRFILFISAARFDARITSAGLGCLQTMPEILTRGAIKDKDIHTVGPRKLLATLILVLYGSSGVIAYLQLFLNNVVKEFGKKTILWYLK